MARRDFATTAANNAAKPISADWVNDLDEILDRGLAVTPQDFGAVADGVTDDSAAFVAAIAHLKSVGQNPISTWYKGSSRLYVPPGHYYLGTTTLDITHTVIIEGDDTGFHDGHASKLRWAPGTTGIRIQSYNTTGASGTTDGTTGGGDGSIIRNLYLEGGLDTDAAEGEYHAIHIRARSIVENVGIAKWQGDGIHIYADVTVNGEASLTQVSTCRIILVRNGVYTDGGDVNVVNIKSVDVSYARQWCFWLSGFLGDRLESCHAANGGAILQPGYTPSVVSHGGNLFAVKAGQEANASVNAPPLTATDSDYWYWVDDGVPSASLNNPAWVSGMDLRAGGSYYVDNANAPTTLDDCYSEGGQGPAQLPYLGLSIGGLINVKGARITAHGGIPIANNQFGVESTADGNIYTKIGAGDSATEGILVHRNATPIGGSGALAWAFPTGNPKVLYFTTWYGYYGNDAVPFQISMNATPAADAPWGTARMNFPLGYGLAGKKVESGTAAPSSGTYNRGDMVWNSAPSAGGTPGWVCTTGGTPGTWKAMANLAA